MPGRWGLMWREVSGHGDESLLPQEVALHLNPVVALRPLASPPHDSQPRPGHPGAWGQEDQLPPVPSTARGSGYHRSAEGIAIELGAADPALWGCRRKLGLVPCDPGRRKAEPFLCAHHPQPRRHCSVTCPHPRLPNHSPALELAGPSHCLLPLGTFLRASALPRIPDPRTWPVALIPRYVGSQELILSLSRPHASVSPGV